MFYVKERIHGALEVSIELNDENVFCACPRCGREVQVDLAEWVQDDDFDLYGTSVYCEECSAEILKNRQENQQ